MVPDIVTHYHRAARPPFLNLSDLSPSELQDVIGWLQAERTAGLSARVFGPRYMDFRSRTEEKLRSLFLDAGGRPERLVPHYFVLGTSAWYEGLSDDMVSVVLPLADLPTDVTSVTYPDSFTAMGLAPDYGLPYESRPYHGRVYRLEQLPELIGTYGLPVDEHPGTSGYHGYHNRIFEKYVEVQLWSDGPLETLGLSRPPGATGAN
jgi:hypothetical protein